MFFTTPGLFYIESLKTFVQNEMNTHLMYKVEYDLYEQFNDLKSPCVEDLEYRKEKCFFDELKKYLIGKYNCSTPFTPKEMSVKGMNFTGTQIVDILAKLYWWVPQNRKDLEEETEFCF